MDKIFFIHIPKAAGTSFRKTVQDQIGREKVLWLGENNVSMDKFRADTPENLAHTVVGGHIPYGLASQTYKDGYQYFATLREPVSRAISLHNFICSRPGHALYEELSEISIKKAIEVSTRFRSQINNLQCNYLSENRQRTSKAALRSIKKNNIKVNTMEFGHLLMPEASSLLGLPKAPEMEKRNTASKGSYAKPEYLDRELLEMIIDLNKEDLVLYYYIKGIYENALEPSYDNLKNIRLNES